jgi:hypothetical protein
VNKYTRLGMSSFIMIALHAAVAGALFGIWHLTTDTFFVGERLLNPDFKNDDANVNTVYASEIVSYLYLAFVYLTLWSIIVSFLWLAFSSLAPIERPGQAKRLSWLWVLLLVVGIGGAIGVFGYYFLELGNYNGQSDLLADDIKFPMTLAWGVVFFIYYIFCGTFFTTPKIARTAVPFAAQVLRS